MTTWIFNDQPFETIPENKYGFVYLITNLISGKMYLGRKYFWSKKIKYVKMKTKKGKKKKRLLQESDWRDYYGSSDVLKADVEKYGKENFKREILGVYDTKGQVNYHETKQLFVQDVLYAVDSNGEHKYYNTNIMGRYYTPKQPSK